MKDITLSIGKQADQCCLFRCLWTLVSLTFSPFFLSLRDFACLSPSFAFLLLGSLTGCSSQPVLPNQDGLVVADDSQNMQFMSNQNGKFPPSNSALPNQAPGSLAGQGMPSLSSVRQVRLQASFSYKGVPPKPPFQFFIGRLGPNMERSQSRVALG